MSDEMQNRSLPHVWSVTELTSALKRTLEATFPIIDLEGEVIGYKRYPSGHAYWTLKDEQSQISAIMFSPQFNAQKAEGVIRDGARLKVRGRVTTGLRSQYQIIVSKVRPLGEGELMQRYIALRDKLQGEGLFAQERKRKLPYLPRRIGIITSCAGAVIHDMCRVLMRRFPLLEIRIFPACVQGDLAPRSLCEGLKYFNELSDWRADIIIFGRGGGSFEDLFCFNDETLVRTIAQSKIPTISAVGHETDFTLADFVADVRAGTPSMAAELAVPEYSTLSKTITSANDTLISSLRNMYETTAQRVDMLADNLETALWQAEHNLATSLESLSTRLSLSGSSIKTTCANIAGKLNGYSDSLLSLLNVRYIQANSAVNEVETKLKLLSPYSVLERGYSLTTNSQGQIIRDYTEVSSGEEITTKLQSGNIISIVK